MLKLKLWPPDAKSQLIGKDPVCLKRSRRARGEGGNRLRDSSFLFCNHTSHLLCSFYRVKKKSYRPRSQKADVFSSDFFLPNNINRLQTGSLWDKSDWQMTFIWHKFYKSCVLVKVQHSKFSCKVRLRTLGDFFTWPQLAELLRTCSLVYHSPLHHVFSKQAQVCPLDIPRGPESVNCSVMSGFFRTNGLWPARPLCPWDFSGTNTGVDCYFLLQEILLTPGIKSRSPALQGDSLLSEPPGKP